MPRIEVNGVEIAYEIYGDKGPPVAITPSGPGPSGMANTMDRPRSLAERLAPLGYRVLIWDRRNTGTSDFGLADADSEYDIWADDLVALMSHLGMSPFYAAGGSSGYLTSIITAHRHPDHVVALILHSPMTGEVDVWAGIATKRHLDPTEVAASRGMAAVAAESVWGHETEGSERARERFLAVDVDQFISCMNRWADWSTSGRAQLGGLSDWELGEIKMPVIVMPGYNEVHPPESAETVHRLIPQSQLIEAQETLSARDWAQMTHLREARDPKAEAMYAPIIDDFIQRVEAGEG